MKIDHKIFGWAFVFGITACLIDVILDYLFFYKGETFLGLLITDVPPHEIYIRGLIMVSYAIFGLFMGWVYADRNEAYQELQAANQQLLASEQELQASNQQFRASNQQLQTTEEELRASCQQLEAGEQQLRAANQQLIAHEHQLESVNQQLNGANQQLEATNQQLDATNQQLASTNQQLETSNQQLEAANRQLLENETKIRRQNKFLNSVIESLGHPFYVIDAKDHSIKLANSAAHAIGLSTSSTYDLLSHKETQQGHEGNLVGVSGQILKTKRPASAEYTHAGMDGSPRHFEFHGYPIFNKQGDVEQIIEYSIDITERKEAEQALEASERSYRAIFNSTGDTILVHDMQTGAILDSNQAATEMLGYTTQEFQHIDTKDISSGQSPYSEKEAAEAIDKAIEEGSNIFEWRAKRKNGELFWIEVSLKRSVINERDCILAVSRDINERKLAEQKLQALSNRQQALLASVPDIIMEVDAENNYTWSNPAGYEFFGKDVLGHEAANYFEGEQDSYNLIQPLWNSDENVIYVESWQRRKDGQKRLLAWWCRVLKDEQGNVTGSLSTARDITEQKQTELLLQEWKSRYETAVRASGHLLYDWNSTTNEVVYGGDIEKILGYTPAEMEGGLGRWQELIHPEDQDHFKAIIEQLIATGTAANLEYRIRKKDGSYIYIEDEGNFIVDADGQATQMIGFAKDITNKKKVEEALRMSDDIVQAIPSGLFTYRYEAPDKLVLLDGNPSAVRLTGIPVNDWIGREFNEIWPEAAQGGITQNYLNVMQSGIPYETDDTIYKDNRLEGAFKVVAFPMGEDRLGVAFENVTERKQAEEALRNSEAKYKSLFDNSLEGIGISQGNQVIAANQALLDIFGYDTLEEFIQIPLLDNVAPESQKMIQNLMDQGKKGDLGPTKFEYQIIRKNGEKRDLEISRTNISLEEERFTQSTFRDITERKRSEEILRDNEELLNNIFESMSDGILVLDRDFNYTHWNRAMEKISTTPRETVINRNKSPWEIFPHLAEQGVDQMMQQAMQGDYVHRENIRYQLSDGAEGYTSEIFLPLKTATGQIRGIVGVIRDVTERHQAEIALKESQERYKTLFDGAPDAIFLAEAETGKIIDANSMACQMTLKSHDEIVGMHQSELHPPETENYAKRAFTEHLTQLNHDDQVQPLVYQLMRSDGTSVSVEIMAQAINIKGQPVVQGVFRDISERLHAEEMRKESEQKYLTLFEHAMDGIITMKVSDENAYITDCNSQVAKMFGHRVDEIVGKSPADFSPLVQPDGAGSKTRVNEIAEMAMADRPRYYEWTHCRQDGACFDTEVTVNRIDVGPASYLLAIVRDITERKQAERALAESEAKFRNIYQQSPLAVEIFDAQGYLQDVNQAGLDLFGATDVVELKGLSLFENPNIPEETVQKLRQGKDVRYEVQFDFEKIRKHNLYRTYKSGQLFLNVWITPLRQEESESPTGYMAKYIDITASKEAERALRDREATMKTILQAAPIGIGQVANRRLGWTNEQVARLTGYSRKELRGQNARILYESQEEYERVARVKDPQIEKTGTGSTETRWKRKDGGICDIVLSSAALDPTDLSAGLIFTALDITQRKHAEAEAQLRRNELAHASRLSTIGEMASGLAHELNQPLTAISTFSAGCLRMLKPGSSVSEEVLAAMQNVAAQATRAGEIIHRIRNFTRKQELKRKNTDINRILTDGTDLIETDIRQKKVKVHLDLGAGIPTVPVDAIQIEQVTLNLIRNGIEAMDDPSITDRRLHIITRITDSKNMVEVSIQDRGVGIDPDKTEEIFDSFYTTKKLGLGIGLSLSRSIIESHGGHLWAASNPAGGATFKFTLPLKIENDI